ncbi:hypothetical protein [Amycolatopsis sp. BJA-103]|uniref:hypothetical protein n=1 Tax=Amycolatopsis sp. BJA-103 TaxID=1911175 RepID=UPI001304AEF9|nr:hypothetical protein [Amycolatopsis sp. BJA-103]
MTVRIGHKPAAPGATARTWTWLLAHDHDLEVIARTVKISLAAVFVLGLLLTGGAR